MTSRTRQGWRAVAMLATFAIAGAALAAAACGGTSSADKTATASAKGGASTPAAAPTSAATKAATTPSAQATQQGAAGGAAATVMIADTSLGKVLADSKGMTLYTYKNDAANSGKSACSGGCLANWPALTIASGVPAKPAGLTGELAVITRDDGAMQVTYNGLPLYYFINDKAPGDTKGDGVAGIWSAARP